MSDPTDAATPAADVDPLIADAVEHVRDRFGATGLRHLIALAQQQLDVAEAAARALRSPDA